MWHLKEPWLSGDYTLASFPLCLILLPSRPISRGHRPHNYFPKKPCLCSASKMLAFGWNGEVWKIWAPTASETVCAPGFTLVCLSVSMVRKLCYYFERCSVLRQFCWCPLINIFPLKKWSNRGPDGAGKEVCCLFHSSEVIKEVREFGRRAVWAGKNWSSVPRWIFHIHDPYRPRADSCVHKNTQVF